jgi:hypothetical protein
LKIQMISALVATLCVTMYAHAAPLTGAVFNATDDAKVQTLAPQHQEQVRKTLAEAQSRGVNIQSLVLIQNPTFAATRIDQCLKSDPGSCGEQSATMACKVAGFRKSFPGAWAVDATSTTFYLSTDSKCSGGPADCGAFTFVICESF